MVLGLEHKGEVAAVIHVFVIQGGHSVGGDKSPTQDN